MAADFSPRILSLITFALISIGSALNIAATATTYWVTNGDGAHEGLLKHYEEDGRVQDIDGRGKFIELRVIFITAF